MDSLQKKRSVIKGTLTRISTFLDALDPTTPIDQFDMKVKLRRLEEIHTEYKSVQDSIDDIVTDPADILAQRSERDNFTDRVDALESRLNKLMRPSPTTSSSASSAHSNNSVPIFDPSTQRTAANMKLPRLDLPKFNGEYQEWTSFHDLFVASVHNNLTISGAQKLQYLKTSIGGDAALFIRSIPTTDVNYDEAWDILKSRYENKKCITFSHLNTLVSQPKLTSESGMGLRGLLNTTVENVRALQVMGQLIQHWDSILVYILSGKLDGESRKQWELANPSNDIPTYKSFITFLESRCRALESVDSLKSKSSQKSEPFRSKTKPTHETLSYHTAPRAEVAKCPICGSNHLPFQCSQYNDSSISQRYELVKKYKLCYNCLRLGHSTKQCKSGSCRKCQRNHHTSLHREITSINSSQSDTSMTPAVISGHTNSIDEVTSQVLLATAIVRIEDSIGQQQPVRALLDLGSQSSFISEPCIQRLGLKRKRVSVPISGVGMSGAGTSRGMTTCHISSYSNLSFHANVDVLILPKVTGILPTFPINLNSYAHLENLKFADPQFNQPSPIDILIGADLFLRLLVPGKIEGPEGTPTAQNTVFGWIVAGYTHHHTNSISHQIISNVCSVDTDQLLKRFWELEELQPIPVLSKDEQKCEEHFTSTHRRDHSGRFVVRLPLKDDGGALGTSRDSVIKRLQSVERRIQKHPEWQREYADFMDQYVTLGHMSPIDSSQINPGNNDIHYLPHHFVLKEASTSTKFRVVFDASSKSSSGVSLNDKLLIGPTIQQDLVSILIRFRTHEFAFTSDIAKMYRQIRVDERDVDCQRIVWRKSADDPIQDFRLLTVTYGTSSAPYLATKCLQQLANDEKLKYPKASEVAGRDFYVDDLMSGESNLEDAVQLQANLIELLKSGGFELRKWTANHPKLLSCIPEEHREIKAALPVNLDETVKTLGLQWHPSSDNFSFTVTLPKLEDCLTKRGLLSDVARIFDPLGWLAPTVIIAKCLFQRLWILGLTWDEPLPQEVRDEWTNFRRDLPSLQNIRIERWLHSSSKSSTTHQLHGFSDASEKAYSAVIYIRSQTDTGIFSTLITSKTKVSPIKQVSIPRLELCGAVLLARLITKIKPILNLEFEGVYAWTDSTIVLSWLQGHPNRWKTFVANRVSEILELGSPQLWRHVLSEDNPADCASRGIPPTELINHSLWWHGPSWLIEDQQMWPQRIIIDSSSHQISELKKLKVISANMTLDVSLLTKFSCLIKLQRVTAVCRRFIHNARSPSHSRIYGPLTTEDLQTALHIWIRNVQVGDFEAEISCCKKGINLPNRSRLLCLRPFLDDKGLLRVGGRLQQSKISSDQKHPIILPRRNPLTNLIISHDHLNNMHAGTQLLMGILRSRYWILCCRDVIRKYIHNCVKCARLRKSTIQPIMGSLPLPRIEMSRPFLHSGVDYAGPISIKIGGRRSKTLTKGYICVFVCMVTKAIHLELVSDLTTLAFIAALKRFVSRRGKGGDLYSDCGSNFIGANSELAELKSLAQSTSHNADTARFLANDGINWHFNPPASPHFGGLWEAGVKSTKFHLRRVVGNAALTFEEMSTTLCQIEACLNSRPLCPMTSDPEDLSALTPGHFLVGDALNAIPEPELSHLPLNHLSRWQLSQRLFQHFWRRWNAEYLSNLQQLPKWTKTKASIKIGDLVVLKDDNIPPMKWKLARITDVHKGRDDIIRVVSVKTQKGIIKRPIVKVCPLPVNCDS